MNKKKTVKIGFSESKNKQKTLMEDMVVANGNQHVIIDVSCSTGGYCIDNMYWNCFITLTYLCCILLLSYV